MQTFRFTLLSPRPLLEQNSLFRSEQILTPLIIVYAINEAYPRCVLNVANGFKKIMRMELNMKVPKEVSFQINIICECS